MAYLTDGYQTLISFTAFPGFAIKEKEVQPPDLDGMGEVDTTTMRNTRWRTKQPKHLVSAGDITLQAQYDSVVYNTIAAVLLNVNGQVVVTFPDTHTVTVYAWLDKFTPASLKEGEFPLAECKVHCSNQTNLGIEQGPVYA